MSLDEKTMNNAPRPVQAETAVKFHLAPAATGFITGPGAPGGQPAVNTVGKPHDGSVVFSTPCVALPDNIVVKVHIHTKSNNDDLAVA